MRQWHLWRCLRRRDCSISVSAGWSSAAKKPETRTELLRADQETVELDGVTYRKRDDLTVILAMGVDHETQDEYEYRKAGQADFLRLIVLDNKKKTVQQLQIDRDTITPVTMLGVLGDRYEPVTQQICLGYAFGDGRHLDPERSGRGRHGDAGR